MQFIHVKIEGQWNARGTRGTVTTRCSQVVYLPSELPLGGRVRTKAAQQEDGEDDSQDDGHGVAAGAALSTSPLATLPGGIAR